MSASAEIHAQLASILERFAKRALLEMSRAVEQEMTRRQMEVETLLLKLQFTESELRSARQNQPNLRSVGTQANSSSGGAQREVKLNFVKINETHDGESQTETHTDDSSAQAFTPNKDGIKSIQIKDEHMEDGQWDSGPISPALCRLEDQDSFSTGTTGPAGVDCDFILTSKMKPGGMWISPVSEEYPVNSGAQSLEASPMETGNMYHIVSFVDTEEVEAVPALWVKNGVCLWPPYKDEGVQRASECWEQPQDSWAAYKVKIIYTASNYGEAQQKLSLAEQQMDLQAGDETDSLKTIKPKTKRNRQLLDDDDTEEEASARLTQDPQIQPPCKRTILSASDKLQPRPTLGSAETSWHQRAVGSTSWRGIDLSEPSAARTSQERPDASSQYPEPSTSSSCDPFIRSLLHDLTTKQEIVMEQQMSLIRMVQDLQAHRVREITDADCLNQRRFPLEDLRSLSALENDLRSCPETRRKVVDELGLLGGVDVKDTVWRIMKQAIKNDFAKTVNWRGVNGKTSFQSLELKGVVIEAVRRNPTCAQITELEVEKAIIRWFHLAGDREGGRKKRTPLQDVGVEN